MPFSIFIRVFGMPILSFVVLVYNFIMYIIKPKFSEERDMRRKPLIISAIVFAVILAVHIAFIVFAIYQLANNG